MQKNLILLILIFFIDPSAALGQNENDLQFNVKELDSIYSLFIEEYRVNEFNRIVSESPQIIKYSQKKGFKRTEEQFNLLLGNTYAQLDDTENAEYLFRSTLDNAIANQDSLGITEMYSSLGATFLKKDNIKALHFFQQSMQYQPSNGSGNQTAFITLINIAEIYVSLEDSQKARKHLQEAIKVANSENFKIVRQTTDAIIAFTEGSILLIENRPQEAIYYIKNSIDLKDYYDINHLIINYENLLKAYRLTGNYEMVNETYHPYDSLRNLRNEKDKLKQLQIARSQVHLDKLERDLEQFKLQNQLTNQKASNNSLYLLFFLILASLFLFIAFALYRAKNKRDKLLSGLTLKNKQFLEARKKAEKLAESNTRFLSTISHELRTPLYGIIGLSTSFLKDPKLVDFKEEFKSLKFSADYLLALVNDVLNMNKIASKKEIDLKESNFEIDILIDNIIQTFNFLNEKHNNKVCLEMDSTIPKVLYGDKTKISQILMNLMSNASKFTEDGTITLIIKNKGLSENEALLYFEVKDTGRGIHPDDQQKVFEEFTQVKDTSDDLIAGTGLGLPIVNKILAALGSSLQMESEFNKGTSFYFELNVEQGKMEKVESPTKPDHLIPLRNKYVLVVDDNKINQLVTQKVLSQYDMKFQTAFDGRQAVNAAQKEKFDFILMDINMPIMNGIEASIAIRKFDSDTPIIALTATNYEDPENEILIHGINTIVLKPFKTEELLNGFLNEL